MCAWIDGDPGSIIPLSARAGNGRKLYLRVVFGGGKPASGRGLQQAKSLTASDGLGAVADTQLAVDVGDVPFDGGHADDKLIGDLPVSQPGSDEAQDLKLPPGEGFDERLLCFRCRS